MPRRRRHGRFDGDREGVGEEQSASLTGAAWRDGGIPGATPPTVPFETPPEFPSEEDSSAQRPSN